ncbi:transposase [Nocardia puris]|uniref:transposase n=1 Tax=Nocardia puris TaxID=208602 RepID=UPI00389990D2
MLAETIRAIHAASRGCYGVRRMHAELTIGMGIEVGSGQVHSNMKRSSPHGPSAVESPRPAWSVRWGQSAMATTMR